MDIEMVFNELSAEKPAENVHFARQWMSKFITTMIVATQKYRVKMVLRLEKNFYDIPLTDGYSVRQWLNDHPPVNKDEIAFFKALKAQRPVYAGFEDTQVETDYLSSTYQYEGVSVYGLHFAYLLKALAISLPSAEQWRVSQIVLERNPPEQAGNSDDIPATITVHHACQPQHIKDHAAWIRERLECDDPWLKHNLPKTGQCPYHPPKDYYTHELEELPTKMYRNEKVFVDHKEQLWLWDQQEQHWDVQRKPYGRDNYFRVTPDGRFLDQLSSTPFCRRRRWGMDILAGEW